MENLNRNKIIEEDLNKKKMRKNLYDVKRWLYKCNKNREDDFKQMMMNNFGFQIHQKKLIFLFT